MNVKRSLIVFFVSTAILFCCIGNAFAMYFSDFVYQSARGGNEAAIRYYITKGYKIDSITPQGKTALCRSVEDNNFGVYRRLRKLGASPNHKCFETVNQDTAEDFEKRYKTVAQKAKVSGLSSSDNTALYVATGALAIGGLAAVSLFDDDKDSSFPIIPTPTPENCPIGTHFENGKCIADCPTGERWTEIGCIPIICSEGEHLEGNECVKDEEVKQCPVGEKMVGDECVPIICPNGTVLKGNQCVVENDISKDNHSDEDVSGIDSPEDDIYNLYSSPKYPDDEANITITNEGDGDVTGMHGISNVSNAYVFGKDSAGNENPIKEGSASIKIVDNGRGTVIGLHAEVEDVTQYKTAMNAGGFQEGIAHGSIDITHTGGGATYGILGDIRAYNAYSETNGEAYGDITIHGDGDIYGLFGYAAVSNGASPWGGSTTIGNINLYSTGDGNIYGMAVSKGNIPGAGGTATSWWGLNAFSEGSNHVEGNIRIHNTGNGNVYGMYGGEQLHNALGYGNAFSKGLINIENYGNGDVYGIYTPNVASWITNLTSDTTEGTINIVNTGNGTTYGMRVGKGRASEYDEIGLNIENSGVIDINHLGSGDVYGIYGGEESIIVNNGDMTIRREAHRDSVTNNIYSPSGMSGTIYGVYGESGSQIFNGYGYGENSLGNIKISQTGTQNVYGVYSNGNVINSYAGSRWENRYDRDGKVIKDEAGNVIWDEYVGFSDETLTIDNYGSGNAYGIYAMGDAWNVFQEDMYNHDKGKYATSGYAKGVININNYGSGNAYGMYGQGDTLSNDADSKTKSAIINMVNVGDGIVTGLRGGRGTAITNSGEININNIGDGTAIGIYGGANSEIINDGNINIYRKAYTDENTGIEYKPATSVGGTAYGIYAESGATVKNTGNIVITGAGAGQGIYLEHSAKLENSGTISFNGANQTGATEGDSLDIYNGETELASVNLNDLGGEVILDKGGRFFAKDLSGRMSVSQKTVTNGFKNEYIMSGALQAESVKDLDLNSKSAMFKAKSTASENGGYDVVMERKNFAEILADQELVQYLEQNYSGQNNEALYNRLKSESSISGLNQTVDASFGKNIIPNFRRENAAVYSNLSRQFDDNLFNRPDENYMGGYRYMDVSMDKDGTLLGSDVGVNAAYGLLKNKTEDGLTYGLGASAARLKSDYDNHSKRKNNIFGLWMPVGYDFDNGTRWFSKLYAGYGTGSYNRVSPLGRYSADTKEYQYGLGNEVRHKINLGNGFAFEPLAELNLLGIYQDNINEGKSFGSLHLDSGNSLSLEGGLGAYLSKEYMFDENNRLGIQIGGVYYVEFLDPDDGVKASMTDMASKYRLKNRPQDDRAVFSLRVNYHYKNVMLYGVIEQETGGSEAFSLDAGIQYKF